MTKKTLEKGDYLLRNGDTCHYNSYVVSGALKAFYINAENGNENLLSFEEKQGKKYPLTAKSWVDSQTERKNSVFLMPGEQLGQLGQLPALENDGIVSRKQVNTFPPEVYLRFIRDGQNSRSDYAGYRKVVAEVQRKKQGCESEGKGD